MKPIWHACKLCFKYDSWATNEVADAATMCWLLNFYLLFWFFFELAFIWSKYRHMNQLSETSKDIFICIEFFCTNYIFKEGFLFRMCTNIILADSNLLVLTALEFDWWVMGKLCPRQQYWHGRAQQEQQWTSNMVHAASLKEYSHIWTLILDLKASLGAARVVLEWLHKRRHSGFAVGAHRYDGGNWISELSSVCTVLRFISNHNTRSCDVRVQSKAFSKTLAQTWHLIGSRKWLSSLHWRPTVVSY